MNVRLEKSSQKMDIKSLRQDSGLASPRPHIIKVSEKKLATQTKQQMALSAWKGTSLLFSLGVKSHPGAKNASRFLPASAKQNPVIQRASIISSSSRLALRGLT